MKKINIYACLVFGLSLITGEVRSSDAKPTPEKPKINFEGFLNYKKKPLYLSSLIKEQNPNPTTAQPEQNPNPPTSTADEIDKWTNKTQRTISQAEQNLTNFLNTGEETAKSLWKSGSNIAGSIGNIGKKFYGSTGGKVLLATAATGLALGYGTGFNGYLSNFWPTKNSAASYRGYIPGKYQLTMKFSSNNIAYTVVYNNENREFSINKGIITNGETDHEKTIQSLINRYPDSNASYLEKLLASLLNFYFNKASEAAITLDTKISVGTWGGFFSNRNLKTTSMTLNNTNNNWNDIAKIAYRSLLQDLVGDQITINKITPEQANQLKQYASHQKFYCAITKENQSIIDYLRSRQAPLIGETTEEMRRQFITWALNNQNLHTTWTCHNQVGYAISHGCITGATKNEILYTINNNPIRSLLSLYKLISTTGENIINSLMSYIIENKITDTESINNYVITTFKNELTLNLEDANNADIIRLLCALKKRHNKEQAILGFIFDICIGQYFYQFEDTHSNDIQNLFTEDEIAQIVESQQNYEFNQQEQQQLNEENDFE